MTKFLFVYHRMPKKLPYLIMNGFLFALNFTCLLSAIQIGHERKNRPKIDKNCVCHTLSLFYDFISRKNYN